MTGRAKKSTDNFAIHSKARFHVDLRSIRAILVLLRSGIALSAVCPYSSSTAPSLALYGMRHALDLCESPEDH